MSSRPSLANIIRDTRYWHLVGPSLYTPTKDLAPPATWVHTYSVEEFAALCPELTSIWEGFLDETDRISGASIVMLIDYWAKQPLIMPLSDPHDSVGEYDLVESFSQFSVVTDSEYVEVSYCRYVLAENSKGQHFPCYVKREIEEVHTDWLDKRYPQWLLFMTMNDFLSLDEHALTALVRNSIQPLPENTGILPDFDS